MGTMTDRYASVAGAGAHDGTSAANAWTIAEATANSTGSQRINVLAGTYIAQDGISDAVMDLQLFTARETHVVYRAYTTTIGDFTPGETPPVVIQAATNTLANAMNTASATPNHVFIGFRFTGASSHGVDMGVRDTWTFVGCRFDTNGGMGITGDNELGVILCEFDNNTTRAIEADDRTFIYGCEFHNEAVTCVVIQRGVVSNSLFYDIANGLFLGVEDGATAVIRNTFDGDNQAASIGLGALGTNVPIHVWNNIFYDLFEGVETGGATTELDIISKGHNLFSSCGSNYSDRDDADTDIDDGTTDPFEDSASRDYRLASGSTAIDAGTDGGVLNP